MMIDPLNILFAIFPDYRQVADSDPSVLPRSAMYGKQSCKISKLNFDFDMFHSASK